VRERFGTLGDGAAIDRCTLVNARGTSVSVLTYGGVVQSLVVKGRDVVLGFDSLESYTAPSYLADNPFFGALIGRFANRIAGARFTLDGTVYELSASEGAHTLHGGARGFDQRLWEAEELGGGQLRLAYTAADGEEGFPGELAVAVTFTLGDDDSLALDYEAVSDRPTVVNLTNHCYWNLAGGGSVAEHELRIPASRYMPVDDELIPTGELADVAGTPFDFREARPIGGADIDHNFVLDGGGPAARLRAEGLTLEITTTEPGLQVFTSAAFDGSFVGRSGSYGPGAGVALETQHFPDSPNRPEFPSTVLRPGETFRSRTAYAFS
jgi:aldose 1-epimerase